jgi:lipopolysaccharide/colanic/teichoic acid biosynthesis glycosyltransferase
VNVLSSRSAQPVAPPFPAAAPTWAPPATVREPWLKRPLDIALAATMLVTSAPAWLVIALGVKLEDRGPIFYRQQRWGRGGQRFHVLKFRTMVPTSDRDFGVRQAAEHDRRITRMGRFLRATGLDELPQIVNILAGQMSFVGPRALATDEHDKDGRPIRYEETPGFSTRLLVRPGLTGLATIYLPKDATSAEKFQSDLLYVQRLSLWLDLRLIALSFWISFRGKWETRAKKL